MILEALTLLLILSTPWESAVKVCPMSSGGQRKHSYSRAFDIRTGTESMYTRFW
jgi:hypothetical protein